MECNPHTSNLFAGPSLRAAPRTRRIRSCSRGLLALDKQAGATDRTGCSAPTRQWGFCLSVAAISGVTIVAGRSPHWPAAIVTDCSMPTRPSDHPAPTTLSFDRRHHPSRVPTRRPTPWNCNTEADREVNAPRHSPMRVASVAGEERRHRITVIPDKALLHTRPNFARCQMGPDGVSVVFGGKMGNGGQAAGPHGRPLCD
jgi:hypothetical protein